MVTRTPNLRSTAHAFYLPWVVCLGLVLLTGCMHSYEADDNNDIAMQTARDILGEAIYVNKIFSECEKLGEDLELEVLSVQQDWLIKNWPLIDAADRYYSEQLKATGVLFNGELISLQAVNLLHEAQQRAIKELNFKQRTTNNQQKFCLNRIATLAKEDMDLRSKIGQQPLPFAQVATAEDRRFELDRIPVIAGNIKPLGEPGRTYFGLTEQFKQECPGVELLTLQNQWPKETYAVYCHGQPLALMTCEWGNCERQEN